MDPSECSLTDISGKSVRHLSPGVNLNQIFHPARHPGCFGCMNSGSFGQDFSHRVEKTSQEFWPPAAVVQHQGVYGGGLHPSGTGPESPRWRCETYQCAAAGATARNPAVGEETYDFDPALEPPLPLRSDDEWLQMAPCLPPQHCLHNYGDALCRFNTCRLPQQPCHLPALRQHLRPCADPNALFCCQDNFRSSSLAQGSVSINVPRIIIPRDMNQVRVMNLHSGGAALPPQTPNRRIVRLPDKNQKVFVTYSSDSAIEVVPFMDFLTQHGFRAAMDIWDSPISRPDGYLLDQPSALIIIAISPNYKADVEGARMDTQSPHTRYIYTMMQNQFIQQGSLNFRFIPVCFLNSSQKHVPSWLQNTRVYLWPQEMEDLLLGLFRAEKYAPPPVSTDLTVTMRPVAPTFADAP
ncbi:uncharacterized protein isoform X1 [Takifugu rubripes]|uniref:uncharacterized protein isoform X1 n=1 Tax=Takifugu rubripes TaxID=31033 RepID=UPI00114576F0|nr:uncharacterized protein LOC105418817 isoform X1 [Takifugu rubripes]